MRSNVFLIGLAWSGLIGSAVLARPVAPSPERIVLVAPNALDTAEDREIALWQKRVRSGVMDPIAGLDRLGWAYVAKGRAVGDAGYFKLAECCADAMAARDADWADRSVLRGHAWLQQHRFAETESLARRLVADRGAPDDFALLSDALMEQGDLAGAIAAGQRLADLRPGYAAAVRIAHLRWLSGDLPGAGAAMAEAVTMAGPAEAEVRCWAEVRLGHYRLQAGDHAAATALATAVLKVRPDYAKAWLLRGQVALAEGRAGLAVAALRTAQERSPLPQYQWWLAEALRANGDAVAAEQVESALRNGGVSTDPRTVALFLATRGIAPEQALAWAEAELAVRHDALTQDALAWTRWAAGDAAGAAAAIALALRDGIADARVWLHAGVMAAAAGEDRAARTYFETARRYGGTLMPSERALLPAPVVQFPAQKPTHTSS